MGTTYVAKLTADTQEFQKRIERQEKTITGLRKELRQYTGKAKTAGKETGKLSKEMKGADTNASKFDTSLAGIVKKFGPFNLGMAGVGAVLGTTLAKQRENVRLIDRLNKSMGVSTDTLQRWSFMAEQMNTDVETFGGALDAISDKLLEAQRGTESAIEGFTDMGLQWQTLVGLSPEKLLETVVVQLGKVEDQNVRTALATQIAGEDLLRLTAYSEDYAEQAQIASEISVMSDEQIQVTKEFNQAMAALTSDIQAFVAEISLHVLPAIQKVVEWMRDHWQPVATALVPLIGVRLAGAVRTLNVQLGLSATALSTTATSAGTLKTKTGALGKSMKGIAGKAGGIGLLSAALGGLGSDLDDLLEDTESFMGDFESLWTKAGEVIRTEAGNFATSWKGQILDVGVTGASMLGGLVKGAMAVSQLPGLSKLVPQGAASQALQQLQTMETMFKGLRDGVGDSARFFSPETNRLWSGPGTWTDPSTSVTPSAFSEGNFRSQGRTQEERATDVAKAGRDFGTGKITKAQYIAILREAMWETGGDTTPEGYGYYQLIEGLLGVKEATKIKKEDAKKPITQAEVSRGVVDRAMLEYDDEAWKGREEQLLAAMQTELDASGGDIYGGGAATRIYNFMQRIRADVADRKANTIKEAETKAAKAIDDQIDDVWGEYDDETISPDALINLLGAVRETPGVSKQQQDRIDRLIERAKNDRTRAAGRAVSDRDTAAYRRFMTSGNKQEYLGYLQEQLDIEGSNMTDRGFMLHQKIQGLQDKPVAPDRPVQVRVSSPGQPETVVRSEDPVMRRPRGCA